MVSRSAPRYHRPAIPFSVRPFLRYLHPSALLLSLTTDKLHEQHQGGKLAQQRVSHLRCVWEGLLIRFIIFHPLDIPGAVLACSGGHPELGDEGRGVRGKGCV
jgi:hypothetical protein